MNQVYDGTKWIAEGGSTYVSATADTLAKSGPGVFYGLEVNVALSASTLTIRDSLTAGAGTVICTIPASSAIGYAKHIPGGVRFSTGLFIDFGGTGTVTAMYI